MHMNRATGLAIIAAGALGGCAYYGPPSPYAYFNVPCPPATAPASSGTITPIPPTASATPPATPNSTAPAAPPPAAIASGQCVAVVPTYTAYPMYYYYPGYFGPPIYSSVVINNPFH
jgi:hypothetical protein